MKARAGNIVCRKCSADAWDASQRGAYLARVNPKGEIPMIVECAPSCKSTGDENEAILRAIQGETYKDHA